MARPSPLLFALEPSRAAFEGSLLVPATPLLRSAPRGDGHSVLVLPGFAAGDRSTAVLRGFLARLGYRPHAWRQGRNLGPSPELRRALRHRLDELYHRSSAKVSLVGWSLGGIYARELARRVPDQVRQVITLGSPFRGRGGSSNVRPFFDLVSNAKPPPRTDPLFDRLGEPPPVPATAIFSKTDGVVGWRACTELASRHTDNIEVRGSHCGLGVNPVVLFAIADRLAQSEAEWGPFDRGGVRSLFYR